MRYKIICQLVKEPLKELADVQQIIAQTIYLVIDLQLRSRRSAHIIRCYYIRIVRPVIGLLLSNLCKNMALKLIWKLIDIFPN